MSGTARVSGTGETNGTGAGPSGSVAPGQRGTLAVVAAAFLVGRRARRDLPIILALLLLVIVSGVLALGIPRQIAATLDAAAREAVSAAGAETDLLLSSTVDDRSGFDTTTAERLLAYAGELPERLPAELRAVRASTATGILGPDLSATAPSGAVTLRIGVLDPAATAELEVREGALPGGAGDSGAADSGAASGAGGTGAVDVAVSEAGATAAGLAVGSVLQADGGSSDDAIGVRVVAIVDTDRPSAPAWTDLPGLWGADATADGVTGAGTSSGSGAAGSGSGSGGSGAPVVPELTVLTDAAAFDAVAPRFPEAAVGVIRTTVDPALFDRERVEGVRAAVDALETSTATITEAAPLTVAAGSGYEDALQGFPAEAAAATARLSTLAAGLLGVAVLVAVLAGTALARRRRDEFALLRSLGASLPLITVHAAVESIAVTSAGCAIALFGTEVLAGSAGSPALLVGVAVVIAAAPVAATLAPLLPAWAPRCAALVRVGAVSALVAVTATAVIALRSGGGAAPRPSDPAAALAGAAAVGVDPLALVAPVLCAAVVALALSPAPALLVRPLVRWAARTRGPGGLLASSSAQEGRSVLTLVAVVLATSAALTSLVLLQTERAEQEATSWQVVGADVRIDGVTDATDATGPVSALREAGATVAVVTPLRRGVEAQGETSSIGATVLAVDGDYAELLDALPPEVPQHASAAAVRQLTGGADVAATATSGPDSAADAAGSPLPVVVDTRLAGTVGTGDFTLEIDDVSLPAIVVGAPVIRPGYLDDPVAIVDRDALAAALATAGADPADVSASAAAAVSVLAVGENVEAALGPDAAPRSGTVVLRSEVLDAERSGALASGIATAALQTVVLGGLLALLALLVTAVLGARRRGRTLALLGALGVPVRAGVSLAVGELAPLVASGLLGGAIVSAVVLVVAGPALGLAAGTGVVVAPWLPLGALAAAVLALALLVVVDTALTRRVRTTDILRTGEES